MSDINEIILESFSDNAKKVWQHLKKHKYNYISSIGGGLMAAAGLNKIINDSDKYHKLKRNLKIAGRIAGGTAASAAAGYGAYKLYNHYKSQK